MKITSGLPVRPELCPSVQPLTPDRIRSDRNFHSVDLDPLDLLRLMTRERVNLSNLSKSSSSRSNKLSRLPAERMSVAISNVPKVFRVKPSHDAL